MGQRTPPIRESAFLAVSLGMATLALALLATSCNGDASTPRRAAAIEPAGDDPYSVEIDPADFVAVIDNPYFPLAPGTVFRLRGETEEGIEREKITVTHDTRVVMGVTTTVVKDVMRVGGEIVESTYDWYAQDVEGNVWYFGEDTAEYSDGEVTSRDGSWKAGVDGALPGIIMSAAPQVTDSYRQEFFAGEAEDMFWVVQTGLTKSVPHGRFDDVVRVLEWTPLEPRVVVEKFYAPGVGLISEHALSGGTENVELLDVR
jgi:hypothetical protein